MRFETNSAYVLYSIKSQGSGSKKFIGYIKALFLLLCFQYMIEWSHNIGKYRGFSHNVITFKNTKICKTMENDHLVRL